jgi:translation initiation factor IF-2
MRLGQLTRQLEVETSEVLKFLSKQGISVDDHPNTKLEDETIVLLLAQFEKPKLEIKSALESPIVIEQSIISTPQVVVMVEPIEAAVLQTEGIQESINLEVENKQVIKQELSPIEEPIVKITTPVLAQNINVNSLDEEIKVISLSPEEVAKLVAAGEIESEIEAQALTLDGQGTIKAKLTKLEGLQVVGKIELPKDPRREKKEQERKAKEETTKVLRNAGRTIDGVHPNKRAKEEGEKIKEVLALQEQKIKDRLEKQRLIAEKEAQKESLAVGKAKKKSKKRKPLVQVKEETPDEVKKRKAREKRQLAKQRANQPEVSKSIWKKIWDFIR